MRTRRQEARIAGLLYLVMALIAPLGLMVVPTRLFVTGNASATADNIRESATLLRLGIASELVHQILFIYLVLALYRLFRPVSEELSRQMVILGAIVSVPIVFVNVLNEIAALMVVSGEAFLSSFSRTQLDALAYLFVRLHGQGISVVAIFWGLWLFPFGLLVIRSGFIPRLFGYLLLAAGSGYLISSFAKFLAPSYVPLISQLMAPLQFCEVPIIFWLAIRGARNEEIPAASPLPASP